MRSCTAYTQERRFSRCTPAIGTNARSCTTLSGPPGVLVDLTQQYWAVMHARTAVFTAVLKGSSTQCVPLGAGDYRALQQAPRHGVQRVENRRRRCCISPRRARDCRAPARRNVDIGVFDAWCFRKTCVLREASYQGAVARIAGWGWKRKERYRRPRRGAPKAGHGSTSSDR